MESIELRAKEVKIFLSFFIIYCFFMHWSGWNEDSRLDLTRAIVDKHRFEIDPYKDNTGDRAYYSGHYYSDKEPGMSFLAVPIYALTKFVYLNFLPDSLTESYEPLDKYVEYTQINPGLLVFISMITVTAFTSCLFSALSVMVVYKLLGYFLENEQERTLLAVIFGLGTQAFQSALRFTSHATGMFFSLMSFYLLFRIIKGKSGKNLYILSGVFSGLAVLVESPTAIIVLAYLVYMLLYREVRGLIRYTLGFVLGVIPLFLYNNSIFGNPLIFPREFVDPVIWPLLQESKGVVDWGILPNLGVVMQVLVFPYRGFFFYSPILLLSLIGLYYMWGENRRECVLLLLLFFGYINVVSRWWSWWGGSTFGLRHLNPITPFFIIPLAFTIKKVDCRLLSILAVTSIVINFVGLQGYEDLFWNINKDKFNEYVGISKNFHILTNPLYDHYLPLLLEHGPRSRIFENILDLRLPVDIRDIAYSKGVYGSFVEEKVFFLSFIEVFVVKVSLLSILVLVAIIACIWYRESIAYLRADGIQKLIYISCILVLLILYSVNMREFAFGSDWYPQSKSEDVRWMGQNATITLINVMDKPADAKISFMVRSYVKTRNIQVLLNNKLFDNFSIVTTGMSYSTKTFTLSPGKNTLMIMSDIECIKVSDVENRPDVRCISVGVKDIHVLHSDEIADMKFSFDLNWWPKQPHEEFIWMSNDSIFSVYNPENVSRKFIVDGVIQSYYKPRSLKVYSKDGIIASFYLRGWGEGKIKFVVDVAPGENRLLLQSNPGCNVASEVEGYNDMRCLSFGFKEVSVAPLRDSPKENVSDVLSFDFNWWPKQPHEGFMWMSQDAILSVYNPEKTEQKFVVESTVQSYYRPRSLKVISENNVIAEFDFSNWTEKKIRFILDARPGRNMLILTSNPICDIVSDVEVYRDVRCLSFGFKGFNVIPIQNTSSEVYEKDFLLDLNWWPKMEGEDFSWMSQDATISLFNPKGMTEDVKLSFIGKSFSGERDIQLLLNDDLIEDMRMIPIGKTYSTIMFKINPGKNTLTLKTDKQCVPVSNIVNGSNDTRCISVGVKDFSVLHLDDTAERGFSLDSNWWPKQPHEDFVWMSQDAVLSVYNPGAERQKFVVEGVVQSYYQPRSLKVRLRDGVVDSFDFDKWSVKKIKFTIDAVPGENRILLHSNPECDVVSEVEEYNDMRCLSFGFKELSVMPLWE